MARITVEDCIGKVNDRFELVILAAYRANGINSGIPITVEREKDKYSVVALREIAAGTIGIPSLRESLTQHFQTNIKLPQINDENLRTEIGENNEADYFSENGDLFPNEDTMNMPEGENFTDHPEENDEE